MVKIHYVKPDFRLPRVNGNTSPNTVLDDSMFNIVEEDFIPCDRRGANLDTSKRFSGNFSTIKDVHFLKGTYFDRDYFRRLYPNINVRIKPELADVIIYDDKAIFENDIVPKYFICLNLKQTNEVLYFASDVWFNHICDAVSNVHSYSYRLYGQVKLAKDSIISKYINNRNDITGCYLGTRNSYYEALDALNKPYLYTTDALNKLPSNLKQNDLSLEECITYFNQIKSGDLQAMKTAMESFVMYNTEKYLPLQVLFYSYYVHTLNNSKSQVKQNSNKLNLFFEANRNFMITSSVINNIFETLSVFAKSCTTIFFKTYPNIDWNLIRKFVTSKEFYDSGNYFNYTNLKVNGISFDFHTEPLAQPLPVEQIVDKNISEFIL